MENFLTLSFFFIACCILFLLVALIEHIVLPAFKAAINRLDAIWKKYGL